MSSRAVVLIGAPGALDERLVARAEALLADGAPVRTRWLAAEEAWEGSFVAGSGADFAALETRLAELAHGRPIDANIVANDAGSRRKRLLVADMDSTIIGQECIDELADFAGLKDHVARITERAMRGEIAFEPALRERVALLKDLPASIIDEVVANRLTLMPGARALVATMRRHGAHTCLVSGGFTVFTSRIAAMVGFNESRGNTLLVGAAGNLTGEVGEPVLGRAAKKAALIESRERLGLSRAETLAVGDGANDLDMLAEAGLGVAYRAKPAVAAAAGAQIDHGDLTALLYLQGYCRDEFVRP